MPRSSAHQKPTRSSRIAFARSARLKRMSAPPSSMSVATVRRNRMTRSALAELCGLNVLAHPTHEQVRRRQDAGVREEEISVVGLDRELSPRFGSAVAFTRSAMRSFDRSSDERLRYDDFRVVAAFCSAGDRRRCAPV
jgi:hypothetical protein